VASTGQHRRLRRRIRSVKSTQQITRAMEMIAASRINRAVRRVEEAVPYARMIHAIIRGLAASTEAISHPLIAAHEQVRTVGLCVNTSDRGLAGAYNTNILRRAERLTKEEQEVGREVVLYAIGRKAELYFRWRGTPLEQVWTGMSDQPTYANAADIGQAVMEAYTSERLDRVWMAYTDFKSALSQVASVAKLLPVDPRAFEGGTAFPPQFIFEPDPTSILDHLIPRYLEHRIYAGLLESAASEHASRQRAMKAATDNAGDIIEILTRQANQARQAAITTEISEIVGGAEALAAQR
jgi:F-type H+-transporting ATPase subunit gamma